MTHYVNQACKGCKDTICVTVCPVDCFHEMEDMLVIDPEECIDCGVCIPECPVDAIKTDCDDDMELDWIRYNFANASKYPVITAQKEPLRKVVKVKSKL